MRACPSCGESFVEGERFCPFDATRLESVASSAPADDALVGTILDERYRLVAPIGEGGVGRIYEAEDVALHKPFAVKVLRDSDAGKPEVTARLRHEALCASRVGHENIVTVHDFGTTPGGAPYVVMDLLRGQDLATHLRAQAPMPAWRAIPLLVQACAGLEAAHRSGIVHRDLKPENLFVARDESGRETIKVVDFGLAKMNDLVRQKSTIQKLTKTGMIFGTPRYLSPEQCLARPTDERSDVYSLGAITYELLAGVPPFDAPSFLGVLHMHAWEPVPAMRSRNPSAIVSPRLEAIVHRALAKDPSQRYASMDAYARALVSVVAETTPLRSADFEIERLAAIAEATRGGVHPPERRITLEYANARATPVPSWAIDAPRKHVSDAAPPGTQSKTLPATPLPPLAPSPSRSTAIPQARPTAGPPGERASRISPWPPPDELDPTKATATAIPRDSLDPRMLHLQAQDRIERPLASEAPEARIAWIVPLLILVSVALGLGAIVVAFAR